MFSHKFIVPGRAYPHPRVTHMQIRRAVDRRKRRKVLTDLDTRILRYLDYLEAVEMCARAARIPLIEGPASFRAVFVFKDRTHGDRVNLTKSAEDGTAAAGVVKNDKQFLVDGGSRIEYGTPERTEITVRELEAKTARVESTSSADGRKRTS